MKMRNKRAISLIVLVITIIVMAILAATVIITLSNTNIISQANEAVNKTEAQQIEEAKILMQADGMLGKNPVSMTIGDTTLTWDDESKTVIEKTTKDGTTKIDTVTIPSGFYYVGGSKSTGLVISDAAADENMGVDYTCTGNQFVWVPVADYSKFIRGGYNPVTKKMDAKLDEIFSEPRTDAEQWEKDEYNAMTSSVQKNGGFYIARFEAGGDSSNIVSKKNVNALLTSDEDGLIKLSQDMYKDSLSVVSTLCYGVQWDAIMNYVSDSDHDIANSVSWGNYGSLQTTGKDESWKAKNIYNLAGNAMEWTMETFPYGFEGEYVTMHVVRGGSYSVTVSACERGIDGDTDGSTGFRVALYIK